ncbi:MAG: hypothetical protein U1E13_02895 [Methylophilaceae bacterium]|nr:hypothetical protein [Methylophilaceae bacterium]
MGDSRFSDVGLCFVERFGAAIQDVGRAFISNGNTLSRAPSSLMQILGKKKWRPPTTRPENCLGIPTFDLQQVGRTVESVQELPGWRLRERAIALLALFRGEGRVPPTS